MFSNIFLLILSYILHSLIHTIMLVTVSSRWVLYCNDKIERFLRNLTNANSCVFSKFDKRCQFDNWIRRAKTFIELFSAFKTSTSGFKPFRTLLVLLIGKQVSHSLPIIGHCSQIKPMTTTHFHHFLVTFFRLSKIQKKDDQCHNQLYFQCLQRNYKWTSLIPYSLG